MWYVYTLLQFTSICLHPAFAGLLQGINCTVGFIGHEISACQQVCMSSPYSVSAHQVCYPDEVSRNARPNISQQSIPCVGNIGRKMCRQHFVIYPHKLTSPHNTPHFHGKLLISMEYNIKLSHDNSLPYPNNPLPPSPNPHTLNIPPSRRANMPLHMFQPGRGWFRHYCGDARG